jgi:SHS2 domain-containing protein
MNSRGFEVLEHTADIGFRAWAPAFADLLAEAACGLVSIVLDIRTVSASEQFPIAARGDDRESLLVNWLNEVLFYTDGKRVALSRFDVSHSDGLEASGVAWGEPRTMRHHPKLIVKGVTYHQLKVVHRPDCWMCEVYLDV